MPRKPLAPTPPPIMNKASLLERFADFPAINVIERRLLNPNDPGSLPILLADEAQNACLSTDHQRQLRPGARTCHMCRLPARIWHLHYCNTTIEGRWAQMKSKGYIPVQIKDLKDQEDVSDLVKQKEENGEMWVRRGDRGKEILMKQPLEIYNHIKALQLQQRQTRNQSKAAMTADLADAAGRELGDEAGQMIHGGVGIRLEEMKRETTTLGKEAGLE